MAKPKFLNVDGDVYTSARDRGNGQPITDIHIASSQVKPLLDTKTHFAIENVEVTDIYISDWIQVKGYRDLSVLLRANGITGLELNWSENGIQIDDTETLPLFTPITTSISADYVQVRVLTNEPQFVNCKLYLKT